MGPTESSFATEICPFPNCFQKCGRKKELGRHVQRHLPHCFYCAQPGCGWTGNLRYMLGNHLAKKHPGITLLDAEHEGCVIYDAKELVKQLLDKEITVKKASCEARSAFRRRAAQLGKQDIWRELPEDGT
jgi:hypothetical protein